MYSPRGLSKEGSGPQQWNGHCRKLCLWPLICCLFCKGWEQAAGSTQHTQRWTMPHRHPNNTKEEQADFNVQKHKQISLISEYELMLVHCQGWSPKPVEKTTNNRNSVSVLLPFIHSIKQPKAGTRSSPVHTQWSRHVHGYYPGNHSHSSMGELPRQKVLKKYLRNNLKICYKIVRDDHTIDTKKL